MDRAEALALLGLGAHATTAEARGRYRALLREHHPDVSATGAASTPAAAAITEAWRVVRTTDEPTPLPSGSDFPSQSRIIRPRTTSGVELAGVEAAGDTLVVPLPPDEAFAVVLDAVSDLGPVSYVDRASALVEAVLTFEGAGAHSLVVSFQGRAASGSTDAFCTLAALGVEPAEAVPVAPVVEHLAAAVRERLKSA